MEMFLKIDDLLEKHYSVGVLIATHDKLLLKNQFINIIHANAKN